MTTTPPPSCPHEDDVLELVAIGQWPARAKTALQAHASECPVCGDLVLAASAVVALRDSVADVRVPDASVVWYRSQRRARAEAARQAGRPLLAAQVAASMVAFGLVIGWLMGWIDLPRDVGGALSTSFASAWGSLRALAATPPSLASVDTTSPTVRWVLAGLGFAAILIPAAFYVAFLVDRAAPPPTEDRSRI